MENDVPQIFDGLTVLDLSRWIPGEYCAKMFADYGAEVIKIERPGEGSLTRHYGPFPGDVPHLEKSATFLHLNTNKRSVGLNLATSTGRDLFLRLVEGADVVIESFRPGTLERMGIGWEAIHRANPSTVLTRISAFGQTGPYRDYDASNLVLQAMGGPMSSSGMPDDPPLRKPGNTSLYSIGIMAAEATIACLLAAESDGLGQEVDVAGAEVLMSSVDRRATFLLAQRYRGVDAVRSAGAAGALPLGAFPCADGYVTLAIVFQAFPALIKFLDDPGLNEYFADPLAIMNNPAEARERLDAVLYPWLLTRTKEEIQLAAQAARVPITAMYSVADMLESPHFRERGFFVKADHPVVGSLEYAGPPFRLRDGWALRSTAPLLGADTAAVLSTVGVSSAELPGLSGAGVI